MVEAEIGTHGEAWLEEHIQGWLKAFSSEIPLIVVPVFNAYDDVLECTYSILESKPAGVPFLIVDDASTDDRIRSSLEPLAAHRSDFYYVRKAKNSGFVGSVNLAFKATAPHDVVVVNSDLVVPKGWLERLKEAAYCRSNIATATPLTNNGTILSVPYRNKPINFIANNLSVEQADKKIQAASLKLRPLLPTAIGHCTYFKRIALEAVGYFDGAFAPGYGEEVDFSQRAVTAGFCHVAADDIFVYHKGSRSFGANSDFKKRIQTEHEQMINVRYPYYLQWVQAVQANPHTPLATAIETARAALLGYRIAIDATCIYDATTGTQVVTLELINALAKHSNRTGRLALIVKDNMPIKALLGLDKLVDEVIRISDVREVKEPLFDILYRPFQVYIDEELTYLQKVAHRFVVSQLDFIAYSNPTYADNWEAWLQMRRLTETVLATADGVVFISQDGAQDAAFQGIDIPAFRTCVSYVGVDHNLFHQVEAKAPAQSPAFRAAPFILMIGTNFKHKNRVYAIKLLKNLIEQYGWQGNVVFAGAQVQYGGSNAVEALEKLQDEALQKRIFDLGAVSEAEKRWLLEQAALVLYPSIYEGFGMVPFEAAAVGTPALTTRATSLNEVLGSQVLYLETLDPAQSAATVWSLLSSLTTAQNQVEAIKARATKFTWEQIADTTLTFLQALLQKPPRQHQDFFIQKLDQDLEKVLAEYQKLEQWSQSLNQTVLSLNSSRLYKLLSRSKLI